MSPSRSVMFWGLVVLLTPFSAAWAQDRVPHIGYVYPAGGRQGTTFLVTVGGQYLDASSHVRISGSGIQAVVRRDIERLAAREANALQGRLSKLEKQSSKDPETLKEIYEIQKKLARAQAEVFRRQALPGPWRGRHAGGDAGPGRRARPA